LRTDRTLRYLERLSAILLSLLITQVPSPALAKQGDRMPAVAGYFYPKESKALSKAVDSYLEKVSNTKVSGPILGIMSPHAGYIFSGHVAYSRSPSENDVFGPVASGDWYPAIESELRQMVDSFLAEASIEELEGKIIAVIAPHAGYRYSGQGAAFSFKHLMKEKFDKVIILAPSHYVSFRGLSILKADYYKTPLGLIKVDVDICESLLKEKLIRTIPYAHAREHSLENMLPFLQRTLNKFKLIPIIMGQLNDDDYEMLARSIRKYLDANTLIVVSSDFTHYGSSFNYLPFPLNKDTRQKIVELDGGAINRIVNADFAGYQQYLKKTGATICGRVPIGLLLKILPRDVKGKLVHYYMSGDSTGDYRISVSYASIVFYH
jgi:AmmeMemoRadiSam system protein B